MEFLLINHPFDCPICDEAGEYKLQDYAYKYSVGISRFDEKKNEKRQKSISRSWKLCLIRKDASAVQDASDSTRKLPKIPNDICTERDHVTIETFPGEELDNPYSMNVIEICPVGALTSKEFRFKSRVWEMSFAGDSVCPRMFERM